MTLLVCVSEGLLCVIAGGTNKGSDCFLLLFSLFSDINQFSLFPQVLMRQGRAFDRWNQSLQPTSEYFSSSCFYSFSCYKFRWDSEAVWHCIGQQCSLHCTGQVTSHPFGHLRKYPDIIYSIMDGTTVQGPPLIWLNTNHVE